MVTSVDNCFVEHISVVAFAFVWGAIIRGVIIHGAIVREIIIWGGGQMCYKIPRTIAPWIIAPPPRQLPPRIIAFRITAPSKICLHGNCPPDNEALTIAAKTIAP